MVFEDNYEGVDDKKALIHAKRWDVYVNENDNLIKGRHLVEIFVHEGNKVLWEVAGDHVVEEATDHDEIGLRGLDFNLFDEDEKGLGREGSSEFPYLIMLIEICPGYWKTQLKRINLNMDE